MSNGITKPLQLPYYKKKSLPLVVLRYGVTMGFVHLIVLSLYSNLGCVYLGCYALVATEPGGFGFTLTRPLHAET